MGNVSKFPRPTPAANFADGYANLMSRLGTTADRASAAYYWVPPLSQHQIEAAYRTSWLTRKVHDLPPFEMTSEGRCWNAKKEQITALEAYEKRRTINLWDKLRRALTVARLHGGALPCTGAWTADRLPDALKRLRRGARRVGVPIDPLYAKGAA